MKPKAQIVDLPVYQPGKPIEEVKKELGLDRVIKLASNENPYGCSPLAREAITAELETLSLYPDGSAAELTAALAEHLNVASPQIIFGCGSDEIIALIIRAFLVPGDETIMADQTFSVYKTNAEIEGAVSIEVPLVDGKHDLQGMLDAITDKTKIIWVCNPNNPTGTIVSETELVQFLDSVPEHIMVVLDEAYFEYVTDASYPNSIPLMGRYPNLVILRTFSKIYGLAALRIGYGVAQEEVISLINRVREPFNTGRLAQAAAKAALKDQAFVAECRKRNEEGIKYIQGELDRLGLSYFPAHGNFIMIDVRRSGKDVFQSLLRKGIIVRPGFERYPNWIRVTVGSKEQNDAFIGALEQVIAEVSPVV
ncbi:MULTISPECIES: histidinol-phosphate transaminase [Paenibacillus]|uniref:Histidinol-phosphate aminotransferase n=2 Tax=Paenibacillus lactis TaxID=228574 RepID=G4HFA3_9BACL|nr:histidinol-phosphate transaminase [Paenibacillus lactis]EHB64420.1 histidinol-phosphate aminotransferase [Paenibacillus lactis 154]MBP1892883.1 histidinol-phosphate aminotransferase [Paenibacillus lactis]MCM3495196.1 histidinol-phosphate transaminase [Paenibacillus lactis]HAF97642.1 histidinol-phosphate transaminase [Paenibacillus lactis]